MKQRGRAIGQPVKGRGHSAVRSKARKTPTAHLSTDHSPEQFDRLKRERDEALEQLSATSEILKIISKSPGELKQVFDAMLEKATRICDAKFATLYLSDGDTWRAVAATRDAPPGYVQARKRNLSKLSPGGPLERVVDTKQVVHIADMKELRPYRERHPTIVAAVELGGFELVLWFPCSEMKNSSAPLASFGKKSDLSQTNRSSTAELRRPGRHRHREHAAA